MPHFPELLRDLADEVREALGLGLAPGGPQSTGASDGRPALHVWPGGVHASRDGVGEGRWCEEALGGSCHVSFKSLLPSSIGLSLAVPTSRCHREAKRREPCWASVPAPGIWLSHSYCTRIRLGLTA